jgi:hypothetical protein
MKATLEFNLPEDSHEFQMATQGADMHSVLWDMDQWLRTNVKHCPDGTSEDTYKAMVECRNQLYEFMNDYNVKFD